MGGARRHGRRLAAIGLSACLPFALASCSSAPSVPASLAPILAGPTPTVTVYPIDTQAWIDGFRIIVSTATASLDPKGGTLTVQMALENDGTDDATLDAPMVVTSGDATFQLSHGTNLPDEPAGSTSVLSLPFDVIGRGNVDDGVIRIGRTDEHMVSIPLRPAAGGIVALQPIELTVTGSGHTASLRIVLRHVELRWDLPDYNDELPTATQALTITYDVTYTGTFSGGFPLTGDNVRLRLPDQKTFLATRQDGHSQTIVLINAGKTVKSVTSRFEIPDGLNGQFALVINDGSSSRSIPFTIKP
jgi:hypothetical protein